MKMHRYVVYVIDFDNYGAEEYETIISQHRHLNGTVKDIQTADIGEWDDEHELNKRSTTMEQYDKYFKE